LAYHKCTNFTTKEIPLSTPYAAVSSLQLVPIEQIVLDRQNPRIRKFLEMYGEAPTPEQFYLALGAAGDDEGDHSATFEKLKNSIQTNQGIIQPVILNKREGQFVCVEGNTRVALYKKFLDENVPGPWSKIMALVYDGMEDQQIDSIRLQVHLVGTRPWDPYSKAKYLHHLRNEKNMPLALLVEFCGGRDKEVVESINAFSDMETYYRPIVQEGSFDTSRFSGFVELQKPNIKQSIVEAGCQLSDFAAWIRDEKLYPLNTVRLLPRILKNKRAREEFLKNGARVAADFLEQPTVSKALTDATLSQLAHALTQVIYKLPWPDKDKICKDPSGETSQVLNEAFDALRGLLSIPGVPN
jgi:hypothetical protein